MKPVTPQADGRDSAVFGSGQPEYIQLIATVGPAPVFEVTTEWEFDSEELDLLLQGGHLQLKLLTFGRALQPIKLQVLPSRKKEDS
jgi:hypothetical protein